MWHVVSPFGKSGASSQLPARHASSVRTYLCSREREFVSVLRIGLRRSLETVTTLEHYTYDPLKHRIGSDALCPSSHTNAQLSPDAVFEHAVAPSSMNSIPVGFEAQLRSHLEP